MSDEFTNQATVTDADEPTAQGDIPAIAPAPARRSARGFVVGAVLLALCLAAGLILVLRGHQGHVASHGAGLVDTDTSASLDGAGLVSRIVPLPSDETSQPLAGTTNGAMTPAQYFARIPVQARAKAQQLLQTDGVRAVGEKQGSNSAAGNSTMITLIEFATKSGATAYLRAMLGPKDADPYWTARFPIPGIPAGEGFVDQTAFTTVTESARQGAIVIFIQSINQTMQYDQNALVAMAQRQATAVR